MCDDELDRPSFVVVARQLADEMRRALERVSDLGVDELARAASAEAERDRDRRRD